MTLFTKKNEHKCFCISEPVPANELDLFQWLPIEHMCILVYLVWKIMLQFNLSSNAKGPFYVGMKKNTNLFYFKQFFYVDTKSWQKEVNFRKENKLLISLTGYRDALNAGRTHGQSSEIHRQSPHADREVKK